MTALQVQINFNKAKALAKEIESIASDLLRLAKNDLPESAGALATAWQGGNARHFIAKEDAVANDIAQTAQNLKKIAQAIRTAAKRTYDAEMRAIEIAKMSSSGDGSGGGFSAGGGNAGGGGTRGGGF